MSAMPSRAHVRTAAPRLRSRAYLAIRRSGWDLAPGVFRDNARRCHVTVHFGGIEDPSIADALRQILHARLNVDLPGHRSRLEPAGVRGEANRTLRFFDFVKAQLGRFDLGRVDQSSGRSLRRLVAPCRAASGCGGSAAADRLRPARVAASSADCAPVLRTVAGAQSVFGGGSKAHRRREPDAAHSRSDHDAAARLVAALRDLHFRRHPRRAGGTRSPRSKAQPTDCR
jgi:hypothetical protein